MMLLLVVFGLRRGTAMLKEEVRAPAMEAGSLGGENCGGCGEWLVDRARPRGRRRGGEEPVEEDPEEEDRGQRRSRM